MVTGAVCVCLWVCDAVSLLCCSSAAVGAWSGQLFGLVQDLTPNDGAVDGLALAYADEQRLTDADGKVTQLIVQMQVRPGVDGSHTPTYKKAACTIRQRHGIGLVGVESYLVTSARAQSSDGCPVWYLKPRVGALIYNSEQVLCEGWTRAALCLFCCAGVLRQELLRPRITDDDRDAEVCVYCGHQSEHPAALHQLR